MNKELLQFDLRSLQLFQVVAETGSFTRAGERLGLTQSAVTRQIQQLELTAGIPLLHRTTRSVHLTEAGRSFLDVSSRFVGEFAAGIAGFREEFLDRPPRVRLGLSHAIANAHLPGLLAHFRRTNPRARVSVSYDSSTAIREELLDHRLDVGIFTQPAKTPAKLSRVHSFRDEFVIIMPAGDRSPETDWLTRSWLAIDRSTTAGALVRAWIAKLQAGLTPAMELNGFDTIIDLVALGLGSSIVPRRALRLHGRRRQIVEIVPKRSLSRQIGVYCPTATKRTPAVEQFVESILFGWQGAVQEGI